MTIKKPISIITLLGFITAVAAVLMLAMAVLGYRNGELHFVSALKDFEWAAYTAVIAMLLSLIGLWLVRPGGTSRGLLPGMLGLVLALPLVIFIVNFEYAARVYPPINDLSTDLEDPPSFWEVPHPVVYPGDQVAELQRKGYPDIKPLELAMDADASLKLALAVAREMGWEIISESTSEMQIEAVATSFLFGFEDYVAVRVQEVNGHARVDMRSHSRLGRIDRGVNASRIRTYLRILKKRASTKGK